MKKKLILLVEDNADDEALTRRALKESKIPHKIIVAHDGVEALDYLFEAGSDLSHETRVMPELILLDLKLPKVEGLEVLKRVRANPKSRLIPVVVWTTSDEERDIICSYENGANSYIRKPVNFVELQNVVRQLGLYWLVLNVPPSPIGNAAPPDSDRQMKPERPL